MKIKIFCTALLAAAMTAAAGCSINTNESNAASNAESTAESAAAADGSSSAAEAETSAAAEDDSMETPDENAASVTLNGSGAELSAGAAGVSAEGGIVTVSAAGDYTFTGTLDDGQIIVDAPKDAKVDIYLNGVTVNCSGSAPIKILQADGVTLHLAEGSVNTFTDGAASDTNACISSKDDLTIKGKGKLVVTGSTKHAIKTSNDLRIKNGELELSAKAAGLYGEDSVQLTGGNIVISSCKDGIKSVIDEGGEAGKGVVTAENAVVDIQKAQGNGIEATTSVTVTSGSIRIHSIKQAVNCRTQQITDGTVVKY